MQLVWVAVIFLIIIIITLLVLYFTFDSAPSSPSNNAYLQRPPAYPAPDRARGYGTAHNNDKVPVKTHKRRVRVDPIPTVSPNIPAKGNVNPTRIEQHCSDSDESDQIHDIMGTKRKSVLELGETSSDCKSDDFVLGKRHRGLLNLTDSNELDYSDNILSMLDDRDGDVSCSDDNVNLHEPRERRPNDKINLHEPRSSQTNDRVNLHEPRERRGNDNINLHEPRSRRDNNSIDLHEPRERRGPGNVNLHEPRERNGVGNVNLHEPRERRGPGNVNLHEPRSQSDGGIDLHEPKTRRDNTNINLHEARGRSSEGINLHEPKERRGAGNVNLHEPRSRRDNNVNLHEPRERGGAGNVNLHEPRTKRDNNVDLHEPREKGGAGNVNLHEPRSKGSEGIDLHEPRERNGAGNVNLHEPRSKGAGNVNLHEPRDPNCGTGVNLHEPSAPGCNPALPGLGACNGNSDRLKLCDKANERDEVSAHGYSDDLDEEPKPRAKVPTSHSVKSENVAISTPPQVNMKDVRDFYINQGKKISGDLVVDELSKDTDNEDRSNKSNKSNQQNIEINNEQINNDDAKNMPSPGFQQMLSIYGAGSPNSPLTHLDKTRKSVSVADYQLYYNDKNNSIPIKLPFAGDERVLGLADYQDQIAVLTTRKLYLLGKPPALKIFDLPGDVELSCLVRLNCEGEKQDKMLEKEKLYTIGNNILCEVILDKRQIHLAAVNGIESGVKEILITRDGKTLLVKYSNKTDIWQYGNKRLKRHGNTDYVGPFAVGNNIYRPCDKANSIITDNGQVLAPQEKTQLVALNRGLHWYRC